MRARYSRCLTGISQEKGIFPYKTECIWFPFKYNSPVSLSILFLALRKLLNPTESSRQVQFPSPPLPDMEMVTFTPMLPSPPPQVWEFLFLVYCVASRQSLHVFPWKPFCLLSIFLHYLPLPSAFQYVFFSPPSYFIFSLTPSPVFASPALSLSPLYFSFTAVKNFSPPLFMINQGSERRHSVGGISREADEISGAHLLACMEIYWAGISNKLAITLSQIDSPPACVYSYCTATTTAAVRGGVAPGGRLRGRGSLALLSGSLPSIRSRKQACTLGLWVTLMVQFLSISEDHIGIYKIRLLYILAPHIKCQWCCLPFLNLQAPLFVQCT